MDWADSWRDAFRIELRAEAVGLASRGWPVLPGTYSTEDGRWTDGDQVRGAGPAPVHHDWQRRLGDDLVPERIGAWWTGSPYTLLVATGDVLDAVEVSATVGMRTACLLRTVGVLAPIAATPAGRWQFLTTPAERSNRDLLAHPDVTVHGAGSYIPVPPSPYPHGIVHWRVKPQTCGWQLAAAEMVQDAVSRVLDAPRSEPTTDRWLATAQQALSA